MELAEYVRSTSETEWRRMTMSDGKKSRFKFTHRISETRMSESDLLRAERILAKLVARAYAEDHPEESRRADPEAAVEALVLAGECPRYSARNKGSDGST